MISGLAIGGLYGLSGYRTHHGLDYGLELGFLSSTLFTASFFNGSLKRQKILPTTLMLLGAVNMAYYGRKKFG
jgi:uncharacterized membrane protein (UPF0136 family)